MAEQNNYGIVVATGRYQIRIAVMVKIAYREVAIRSLELIDARRVADLKNSVAWGKRAVTLTQKNPDRVRRRVQDRQVWYAIPVEVCCSARCRLVVGGDGRPGCRREGLRIGGRAEGSGSQNKVAVACVLK